MTGTSSVGKTGNKYVDGLLYGAKWVGAVTFSFTDSAGDYESGYANGEPLSNFAQVSSADMQAMRAVLLGSSQAGAGAAVGLQGMGVAQFTLLQLSDAGSNGADIRIGQSSQPATAYAYTPAPGPGGDVWLGTAYAGTGNDYRNPILGNYANLTLAHELGHALGLKHAQEAGGVANTAVPADRDDLEFTIMSYRAFIGASTTAGYGFEQFGAPQSFMMLDIAALQQMYGANFGYRAGDNTYRWNAQTGELAVDGIGQGQPGANSIFETLWDGGGHDTFDLSNYAGGVNVDLAPGGWSTLSTAQLSNLGAGHYARGNVFNAMLFNGDLRSLIEDAIGGAGNDTLGGNQADNHLWGGAGNDSLAGGAGADTLEGGPGGYPVRRARRRYLHRHQRRRRGARGCGGRDRPRRLHGRPGPGNQCGGPDPCRDRCGQWHRQWPGKPPDRQCRGQSAGWRRWGGYAGGRRRGRYLRGRHRRRAGGGSGGGGGTDLVLAGVSFVLTDNVENLTLTGTGALNGTGNALGNILLGNAGANRLVGGAGDDLLMGAAGNDTLDGGSGSNTLDGGQGNDTYIVGSASDLLRRKPEPAPMRSRPASASPLRPTWRR